MADKYWKIVEPVWDRISIYDGADSFLNEFNKASLAEKTLFAAHWTHSEIMNGGLGQYFSNPTGVLAPEAVKAFIELGMPKCAEVLAHSMRFFGEIYPRDRLVREEKIEDFLSKNSPADLLIEYEDDMADLIEEENGGFWDCADKYAEKG
jgi:hypothetical protein